jgi:hypothetical protein
LDRYTLPKNFKFLSSISWGLCTGIKGKKEVLFGLSTGTKSDKLQFYSSNILNSSLVPVLNPKSTSFLLLIPVQRPQEIDERNLKFLGICTGPNALFLDIKIVRKIFEKCIWYLVLPSKKIFLKTKVVSSTKYGGVPVYLFANFSHINNIVTMRKLNS